MTLCKTCGYSSWCDCPKADNKNVNSNELAEDLEGAKLVIVRLNDMLRQQQAEIEVFKSHPVKKLSRMDVYELAIESGFMLSTQYGEAEHKLMPVSDGDTLVKLANAILRKAQE